MEILALSVIIIMYIFGFISALYALSIMINSMFGDIIVHKIKIIKSRKK
jgi:hypothetical protein